MRRHSKSQKPYPLFRIDHDRLHTAFLFETLVTTTIITLVFMLDDVFNRYVERQNMRRAHKYLLHTAATFVCVLTTLYAFLFLFGYGQVLVPR